jgi:hypothetical protein
VKHGSSKDNYWNLHSVIAESRWENNFSRVSYIVGKSVSRCYIYVQGLKDGKQNTRNVRIEENYIFVNIKNSTDI